VAVVAGIDPHDPITPAVENPPRHGRAIVEAAGAPVVPAAIEGAGCDTEPGRRAPERPTAPAGPAPSRPAPTACNAPTWTYYAPARAARAPAWTCDPGAGP